MTDITDIEVYRPPAELEPYQARMAMTPEQAKALDEQLSLCIRAVLRPGTDFGTIPGAGDRMVLFKPGAEKLLQWFGFGFTCDRTEIDADEDGQRQGVTYRCTVTRRLPDGATIPVTTCEGYAGYDELKFFKPVTDAERHRAEARERGYAAKDRRPADPTKWKNLEPYRAPWNTVIKMAQKRAIVGAAITATAAAGRFGTEEDHSSPVADDGSTWYEQALEAAFTFTTKEEGDELYVGALHAARDGLCTHRQKDHIQNRVRQRQDRLKNARVIDLAPEDSSPAAAATPPAQHAATPPAAAAGEDTTPGPAAPERAAGPGTPGDDLHRTLIGKVQERLIKLGFTDDDGDEPVWAVGKLAGVNIEGLSDLDQQELLNVLNVLAGCKTRAQLEAKLARAGDGNA